MSRPKSLDAACDFGKALALFQHYARSTFRFCSPEQCAVLGVTHGAEATNRRGDSKPGDAFLTTAGRTPGFFWGAFVPHQCGSEEFCRAPVATWAHHSPVS